MEIVSDLFKILVPAGLVLVGMFMVVKNMISKEIESNKVQIREKGVEITLPLRLQAAERLCLFLERTSLNNLIIRVNEPGITSGQLHQKILAELRNEFNHNLSQQVYVSPKAWSLVRKSVQDITTMVNKSFEEVDPNGKSMDLAKIIFEKAMHLKEDPTSAALRYIKGEVQQFF